MHSINESFPAVHIPESPPSKLRCATAVPSSVGQPNRDCAALCDGDVRDACFFWRRGFLIQGSAGEGPSGDELVIPCQYSKRIHAGRARPRSDRALMAAACCCASSSLRCCCPALKALALSASPSFLMLGRDVVVPVASHCTLHWPLTHHMLEFAREPTQTPRLTNGGARKRDSMTPEVLNSSQVPKVLVAAP
jgi:hypothetical protein